MLNLETANKGQLRQAMREAGLSYDGLNVEGMRAKLAEVQGAPDQAAQAVVDIDTAITEIAAETVREPVVFVQPISAPVVPVVVPVARPARPEANGVKQPAVGTICRQIWDYCDEVVAGGGTPKAKELRAWGAGKLDDTTMTVQFYRWRKFKGVTGRQA